MTASGKELSMSGMQDRAISRSSASSPDWLAGSDESGHWIIVVPV